MNLFLDFVFGGFGTGVEFGVVLFGTGVDSEGVEGVEGGGVEEVEEVNSFRVEGGGRGGAGAGAGALLFV